MCAVKEFYVYIVASPSRTIYTGMTSNLEQRMWQHKTKVFEGFTSRYRAFRLVWFGMFANVDDAIAYERRLKGWRRDRKIALIEQGNPRWHDLSHGGFDGQCQVRPALRRWGILRPRPQDDR
jgi:putative endonuclease